MRKSFFIVFVVCCVSSFAQLLERDINRLVENNLPNSSEVSISVYDLTAKKMLYSKNAQKLCRPASTLKLLTAITYLSHPRSQEPFQTKVYTNGFVKSDTLHGDVYLLGGFDPEFDDLAMDSLVQQFSSLKCKVISGKIYGDVSMKDSLYWGNGWAWDDTPEPYQPYLSPLMFCKDVVKVLAFPASEKGAPARLKCTPQSSYYQVTNKTHTKLWSAGYFKATRRWMENSNEIVVTGNVAQPSVDYLNIYNPSDFFMHTFVERLERKGISILYPYEYKSIAKDDSLKLVASYSTPTQAVLKQLLKESDNLNAQAMLCRMGEWSTGNKYISDEDGVENILKQIEQLGFDADSYKIVDGCGLSNYNYISSELILAFLKHAFSNSSIFRRLFKALPIAGIDGTLKHRMKNSSAYRKVHAKTGSFTAVNNLAGYLKTRKGHVIAFSIMNQNILSAHKAMRFQDALCQLLCK